MLVLFVTPSDNGWTPIGLHRTWIDLEAGPKFRPDLRDGDDILKTKKMRGSKSGGLLPLIGRYSTARRVVAGEGIETVLHAARLEARAGAARPDTFYCAAGDLGNLAGKATDRLRHPERIKRDKNGRGRPVFIPGETPDFDSLAMPIADHVEELVLVGDGDSDAPFTEAAMMRAARRHARPGRDVTICMTAPGTDLADGDAAL